MLYLGPKENLQLFILSLLLSCCLFRLRYNSPLPARYYHCSHVCLSSQADLRNSDFIHSLIFWRHILGGQYLATVFGFIRYAIFVSREFDPNNPVLAISLKMSLGSPKYYSACRVHTGPAHGTRVALGLPSLPSPAELRLGERKKQHSLGSPFQVLTFYSQGTFSPRCLSRLCSILHSFVHQRF